MTKANDSERGREAPEVLMRYRPLLVVFANLTVIGAAYTIAFFLRFDLTLPDVARELFLRTVGVAIAAQYLAFHLFKLTRGWWRYVGIADLVNTVKAAVIGAMALATHALLFERAGYPRSLFFLFPMLVIVLSMGARIAVRIWRRIPAEADAGPRRRVLIIGAGDTGEALLREARQSGRLSYQVVAFLDDDAQKKGAYINGVPVIGGVDEAAATVKRMTIDEIIVATPSASGQEMRRIIEHCRAAGVPFKTLPATWEVLHGRASFQIARDVDINDLLRRPPVQLDLAALNRFLTGKRVLVTGAAGSIGSEICDQVLRYEPAELICLDHDENALFFLERSLRGKWPGAPLRMLLADITDPVRIETTFATHKPEVVFHAAAHKHVPIIEANPVEGLRNNVFGTELVASAAGRHDATAFVLISTDKAVNPSSIMGSSKRIAEQVIQQLPFDKTRFTAVRFGNVLGSQGSLVPILKQQIAAGGPVTITHPEMRRYFMTIPEAVELVLQAGAMGREDEVFILDMGEPVKILDMARDLITLSGLRPDIDIPIVFSGTRPGEKLFEELFREGENADRTSFAKLLTARQSTLPADKFRTLLEELRAAVQRNDEPTARALIPRLVPEYQGAPAASNVVPISAARKASIS